MLVVLRAHLLKAMKSRTTVTARRQVDRSTDSTDRKAKAIRARIGRNPKPEAP